MKGLENQSYLIAYIISNVIALLLLWAAWRLPRLARLLYFLLFGWACWINWTTARNSPTDYLGYADLSFLPAYRHFIRGWFSEHIPVVVGLIAVFQGLIAISLLGKGTVYRVGCIGAILFLLAIIPLGVGSAFPCTLVMAISVWRIYTQNGYLWQIERNEPSINQRVHNHIS